MNDTTSEVLSDAQEAWLWHDADSLRTAGYGHHMAQMLYRLPKDGQTVDMKASIERILARLAEAEGALARAWDEGHGTSNGGCVYWPDCAEIGDHVNPYRAALVSPAEPGERDHAAPAICGGCEWGTAPHFHVGQEVQIP